MMYTENSSHNLSMSSSVPLFRPNSFGRASYPDLQPGGSLPAPMGQNKSVTLEQNTYKMNEGKMADNGSQPKKLEMPFNLFSSQKLNNTMENKQYTVTHSQIQGEPNQAYRFQFKRNTQKPNKVYAKQDSVRNNQGNQRYEGFQEVTASNVFPYPGAVVNQEGQGNTQRDREDNKSRVAQFEKKIKDLQNQLKFEQKYANDLYKSSQEAKKEMSKLSEHNNMLQQQVLAIEGANEQLIKDLRAVEDIYRRKKEENEQLKSELQDKRQRIALLQQTQETSLRQIEGLREKIDNFNSYYRNELYEQRIRQLNEQVCSINGQLAEALIEKNRLTEQLKFKNEKLLCMSLQSPSKNKTQALSITEKSNEIINSAFQQSIKLYQNDVRELKEIIENQNEQQRKLREEMVEQKKDMQILRQEMKINNLKSNAEKKNIQLEKERMLIEKGNQISSLGNRLKMLEERYAKALREIEEKDRFLQQHLVGRTKDLEMKEYIDRTMKQYRDSFESRFALQEKVKALQEQLRHKQQ